MNKSLSVISIIEKYWSGDVKTKYHPPEGTFKKSGGGIKRTMLKGARGNKGLAVKRMTFYLNRAGKNLSPSRRAAVKKAINKLKRG